VERPHQLVRVGRQDRERLQLERAVLPRLPQARETEQARPRLEQQREFLLSLLLPLVEAARRDEAVTLLEGRAERRLVGRRLRAGVDRLEPDQDEGRFRSGRESRDWSCNAFTASPSRSDFDPAR
jgi:hypothetical protein